MSLCKILDMDTSSQKSKYTIGNKGEMFLIDKLKTRGFELYGKNIKYINAEIDVVMYKYDPIKYVLEIRIIEVKTRGSYQFDLESFGIQKKWGHIRAYMFEIKEKVEARFDVLSYSHVHFDLALVRYKGESLSLYSYIKEVNLLL